MSCWVLLQEPLHTACTCTTSYTGEHNDAVCSCYSDVRIHPASVEQMRFQGSPPPSHRLPGRLDGFAVDDLCSSVGWGWDALGRLCDAACAGSDPAS